MRKKILKRILVGVLTMSIFISSMPFRQGLTVYGAATDVSHITDWIRVYANNEQNDYLQDQQTGSGSVSQDIVGNTTYPSTYMCFTDDEIAFRIRVSNIDGTSPYQFKNFTFVGIDADVNGSIDFFLGMYNPTGNNGRLGIYSSNTGYTNMSPSTTGISGKPLMAFKPVADVNYYITQADSNFNSSPDYFLSFKFSVADIKAALAGTPYSDFNKSTPFRFITGTAAQDNSFNQDINGMDRSAWSSGATWESLNIFSDIVSADGTANTTYCTVRFDKNTGDSEASPSVKLMEIGEELESLPTTNPTKRGMFFQEWNTKPDGSGEKVTEKTVINEDTIFYAIWSDKRVYTVTFSTGSGAFPDATTTITVPTIDGEVGENMPENPIASKNFLGWNTLSSGSGTWFNSTTIVSQNITVYAQYTNGSKAAIFYDNYSKPDGGDEIDRIYAPGGSNNFGGVLPVINRTGYTFDGWFLNDKTCSGTAVSTLASEGNYYAKWATAQYSLLFNENANLDTVNGMPSSTNITDGYFGDGYSEPTREGYKFIEWNRNPLGDGEAMYPSSVISAATTVYAIWEKVTKVTFDSNGGEEADQTINATSEKLDFFPQPPSKVNYTFLGWSETNTNDANTIIELVSEDFDADKRLYAVWSPIYKVTFDGNTGGWVVPTTATQIPNIPTAYGSVLYFPDEPIRTGYEFIGWKDSSSSSGNDFTMSTNISNNMTVYAQWKVVENGVTSYTITSTSGANGSISPSGLASVTSGSSKSYTFTPNTGYKVSSIIIDKDTLNQKNLTSSEIAEAVTNGYTFVDVKANHTIEVAFEIKKYDVTHTVTSNILYSGGSTSTHGMTYTDTLTAKTGYLLPTNITVKVGGVILTAGTDYTYSKDTGTITINGNKVTGAIEIIATPILKTFGVTDEVQDGTFTGNIATYGTDYNTTVIPDSGHQLPTSIVITVGGTVLTEGFTYNSTTGAVHIDGSKIIGPVVITASVEQPVIYTVTNDITNGVYIGGNTATNGIEYYAEITVGQAYKLPESITVKVNGAILTVGTDYTYSSSTGELVLYASKVTGNIEIIAIAELKTFNVGVNIDDSALIGDAAVYGMDYNTLLVVEDGYMLPDTITIMIGGKILIDGYTYNKLTGEIYINGSKITGPVQIIAQKVIKVVEDKIIEDDVIEPPKTGDESKLILRLSIVALSGIGVLYLRRKKKFSSK